MIKSKKIFLFSLLMTSTISIQALASSSTTNINPINTDISTPQTQETLVFDHYNHNKMPNNFRKTTTSLKNTKLNINGLSTLNISGSEQYSQDNLKLLKSQLPKNNLYFIDLRQESHGFINGLPISFEANGNKANIGLSKEEVIKLNNSQLASIKLNIPILIQNKSITPIKVIDENTLIKMNNDHYIRVTVTDTKLPTPDMVDFFVENVKNLPKDSWLHFHCKEGIGRTTTFMIMYDMMHNAKKVSMNDIITRQIQLGNLETKENSLENQERMILFKDFYNYCKIGDFKIPFSKFAPTYKGN